MQLKSLVCAFTALASFSVASDEALSLIQTRAIRDSCKDARAAVKQARQIIKDLKNQLKAARADLKSKRGDIAEACPKKEKKQADGALVAYWDSGSCGPMGDDYNAYKWCGGLNINGCKDEVETDLCDSGVATKVSTQGTGQCCSSVTIDGCPYAFYTQYACKKGKKKEKKADGALVAYWDSGSCGPMGDDYNAYKWCGGLNINGCKDEVETDLCDSGVATKVSTQGTGQCCSSVTIDGCPYAFYTQYACKKGKKEKKSKEPQIDGALDNGALVAYWDSGACGPRGDDYNAYKWCGGLNINGCKDEVETNLCNSGVAIKVSTQGTGQCCSSVNIAGCNYAFYTQYACKKA